MKKTIFENFKEKSIIIHDNKYDYSLVNYINSRIKIKIICPVHGVFEQIPNNHLASKGCFRCGCEVGKIKQSLGIDSFVKKCKEIHGEKYDYSSTNYINSFTKVKVICNNCKFIHSVRPKDHYNAAICEHCEKSGRKPLSLDEFIHNAKNKYKDKYDYSLVDKYVNNKTKVKIICKKHGLFEQTPQNHISGKNGCTYCKESNGEKTIEEFLRKNNINFIREKKFNECRGIKKELPFDFYLPDKNILIEYDGQHHYKSIEMFGGEYRLNNTINSDKTKTKFAIDNGFELIRVPYYDFNNIENILTEKIC